MMLTHWEIFDNSDVPEKCLIRWLCFARIGKGIISLHWRGFSHVDNEKELESKSQFQYWKYVPGILDELSKHTKTVFDDINLHDLVIHSMWDTYRYNPNYYWSDRRIRAEA